MRINPTLARTVGAAVVGIAATAMLAAPANAGDRDAVCESGEICLYYSTNTLGGTWTINDSFIQYFSDETFKGSGGGQGSTVDNNSASGRNRATICDATLNTGTWQTGSHYVIPDGVTRSTFGSYNNQFSSYIFCN